MSMDEYMKASLEAQLRSATALELIAKHLGQLGLSGTSVTERVGELSHTVTTVAVDAASTREEADKIAQDSAKASQAAGKAAKDAAEAKRKEAAAAAVAEAQAKADAAKAAKDAEAAKAAKDKEEADALAAMMGDEKPADAPKPPSVDDVRAALKSYAQTQGNPAAMKLLNDFKAKAVSELPEDKRVDFIAACKV
jgi:hypothetical protein